MNRLRVGVVGCGYWGPNLIRNFAACPLTEAVAACDASPERRAAIGRGFGGLELVGSLDELLALRLDAVAIATPVSTHFELASRCLEAGLHVLVEKPMTAGVHEGKALVELAERLGRVLMVDHTYLFGGPVRKVKEVVESGELGELYYVDSVRINLGLFQRDVNVIWDLAPHDLSIVDHVLGREARSISAWGCGHADPDVEDIAYVNVDFDERLLANFHVNWLSPVKVRQMIFAGSRKSLIFNELNPTEPIKVYDRGIELGEPAEQRRKLLVSYRTGDVWSPHVEAGEALQAVVSHFAECIRDGRTPISDGRQGLRVVRLLEAATRSIRAQGGRVVLPGGIHANGLAAPRADGPGQLRPDRAGRPAGEQRRHPRVRQPVRVPDR
jgi:predicted dehydrogenase